MPRPKTAAADYKRLTLRVPQDLLAALQAQAATIGRPLNTQAIFTLRSGLGMENPHPFPGEQYGHERSPTP
jgi:hypothetical protein